MNYRRTDNITIGSIANNGRSAITNRKIND